MKIEEPGIRATTTAGIHLTRILVPVDFSPLSNKALNYAAQLGKEFNAALVLLHVVEAAPTDFDGMIVPSSNGNGDGKEPKKKLNDLATSARASGIKYLTGTFRRGLPSHEIVEAAQDLDVDLIVIATHGYTGWKHFCIGSTAERVVRAAPCPVLVVREKENEFAEDSE